MTRVDFLKSLGLSGTALLAVLTSCQHEEVVAFGRTTPGGPVDFELDLTLPINKALWYSGGYVISNGLVIARTAQGTYVAATRICSHGQQEAVIFEGNKFVCPVHGAQFDLMVKGLNALGSKGIQLYKVEQMGSRLWIHS